MAGPAAERVYDMAVDNWVDDPRQPAEEETTAPVVAPALGYSILANLGDEKQLTVQCFVDSEEPLASIHNKIDKAMAVIDRQKAKYRKADCVKELDKMERTNRQLHEDLARLEGEFEKNQTAFDDAIARAVKTQNDLNEAAYGRGRAGGPVGHEKARVNALKAEVHQLNEQKAKAQADRDQARQNIAVSISRYEEEIGKMKEQIAECEAIIGGET